MRRSFQDRFKSFFGLWPYRCQMCNMRFSGPQDPDAIAKYNASTEEEIRQREEDARDLEQESHDKHSDDLPEDPGKK
jgi:hypothetical protein